MRTMTYRKLMKQIEDGYAEITAWTRTDSPALAEVTFFKSDGTSRREHVEVTNVPAEQQR